MSSADDFFGGGGRSAQFPTLGTVVGGPIVRVGEPMQQRDPVTLKPKVYDDSGKPMMQLPVEVQTNTREDADDDGVRTIWIKGQMKKAVQDALNKTKSKLRVGGTLIVKWNAEEPNKNRALNAQKIYVAAYQPPAADGGFFDEPAAPVAEPAPVAQPQPTPSAAPSPTTTAAADALLAEFGVQ